jgi:hypothetical protein
MIHILPIDDLEPHIESGTSCKCNPKVEIEEGELIVIHNAFDLREVVEKVKSILTNDDNATPV